MTRQEAAETARAIDRNFTSPNAIDSNGEPANVVDGLYAIAWSLNEIAHALKGIDETLRESRDE